MSTFKKIGGVRLDNFNATYPFATLSGDSDRLVLRCLGRDYNFPRNRIRRLSRHRGIFSIGLRIEHSQDALPQFVIFWASMFFWTSGFRRLKTALEELGYQVSP
jgi:hypothetical protein